VNKKILFLIPVLMILLVSMVSADLTTDLEAYYKFDVDGSDATPNGYDATVSGASLVSGGKISKAYDFDGVNDGITAPVDYLTGYPFQLDGWFKLSSSGASEAIVSVYDSSAGNMIFGVRSINGNIGIFGRNTAFYESTTTTTFDDGDWHFYNAVFESSTNRTLYIDRVKVAQDTSSVGFVPSIDEVSVGFLGDVTPDSYFSGVIDEPDIYSRSLSGVEMDDKYNSGLGLQYPFTPATSSCGF